MFPIDDTIVAISSAAGSATRAIVRLSGPEALRLAAGLLDGPEDLPADVSGFTAHDGRVRFGAVQLPARVYVFRGPRSYTRQDVVELHVPGSAVVAAVVQTALVSAGARRAEGGEFTARAFFSGRIDLSSAEAVADLIHAADEAQVRAAAAAVDGWVHTLCSQAAEVLTECLASVEASIDLADQQIELDSPVELAGRLTDLAGRLESAAASAREVPESADVPRVVLAGRPNVGKSSLLNALTGTPRAIVSAMAGTTRDVLSAVMEIDGSPVRLQDAAGLVNDEGELSAAMNNAARRAAASADVILLVVDAAECREQDEAIFKDLSALNPSVPMIVLANKSDLPHRRPPKAVTWAVRVIETSATTGKGLDCLAQRLRELLAISTGRSGQALGLHQRQKGHLSGAAEAARRAVELLTGAESVVDVSELVAVELRDALWQIGCISGQVATEDVLGAIFRRFCVGK